MTESKPLRMEETLEPDEWMDPSHVMVVFTAEERDHLLATMRGYLCPECKAIVAKLSRVATPESEKP